MFSDIESLKHNHIICIQDTVSLPGKFLLRELISSLNDNEVHVFCYESPVPKLRSELDLNQASINYHDCLPSLSLDTESEDEFEKFVISIKESRCGSKKLTVVIDSLSAIFLEKPTPIVYRLLCKLLNTSIETKNKVLTQVIAVLHEDALVSPKNVITQLNLICRVWMKVQVSSVEVAIRKSSGKVSTTIYEYKGRPNDGVKWIKKKQNSAIAKSESNETPISTFKMTLSESEKKARDAVQLPYERCSTASETTNCASIIYEPDEFDDWDEEDPDNDLEFS